MDPGRRAMIEGRLPPAIPARRDPKNRVSKTTPKTTPHKYLTQDELSQQFVADEDKFVLKQAKKKADIRVRERRAKPIDYLAFNLRFVDSSHDVFDDDDADVEIDIPSPETIINMLDDGQLQELDEEMTSYHTLETDTRNREYWTALRALCADRRQKLQPSGPEGRAVSFVASDIDKIMAPKTYEQLEAMEEQVKAKLRSTEPVDTDYWEGVLRSLLVWKARAKVRDIYAAIERIRREQLGQRNPAAAQGMAASDGIGASHPPTSVKDRTQTSIAPRPHAAPSSPARISIAQSAVPPGTERFALTANEDFSQATKALYEREVARGLGDNEEIFTAEEAVPNTSSITNSGSAKPQWAEKYRPRKPRYFNRVQMGYEWNKYNQTHYDHDHPPPKVVQGYRFNIFYPDLIDKTKTPTFKIVREGGRRRGESFAPAGEEDTCLIRFIAGPPYEDIAFRIVDREWDYSAKRDRGYRSSFDKGILQLHFQFKKIYYRK